MRGKPEKNTEMRVRIDEQTLQRRKRLFVHGDDTNIALRCGAQSDNLRRYISKWISEGIAPASVALVIKQYYEEKAAIDQKLNTQTINP